MIGLLKNAYTKFISLPYWWLIFGIFLFIWTIQVNPPLNRLEIQNGLWGVQILQSQNFSDNDFLENIMYGYNRALRLAFPALLRLLHIAQPRQAFILQLFIGLIFQIILVKACLKASQNNIKGTILFTFACTYYYFSNTAAGDTFGHGDALAFLFILGCIATDSPILVGLCLFGAYFANERTFTLSLPSVVIWWLWDKQLLSHKKILFLSIPLSIIIYAVCRYLLLRQPHFDIQLPNDIGFFYLKKDHSFFNNYMFAFGSLWVLFFYWLFKKRQLPILIGLVLFATISAFIVADQIRGLSFAFPLFIIAFREIHKIENTNKINNILLWVALIAIILPNFNYYGEYGFKPTLVYLFVEKIFIDPIEYILQILQKARA
ncbi:MAG: hypothetical protein ACK4NY_06150 [Spirosomataceae bacterium]